MASSDQTRLLIVEDVPQVAQYIRGLLNAQARVKLLEVLSDGSRAVPTIKEMRPDIVLVDALLQGRIKGLQLVEMIRPGVDIDGDMKPDVDLSKHAGLGRELIFETRGFEEANDPRRAFWGVPRSERLAYGLFERLLRARFGVAGPA